MRHIAVSTAAPRTLAGAAFLLAVVALASPTPGQTLAQNDAGPANPRRELESREGELRSKRARERELEAGIEADRAERERLNSRLIAAGASVQKSEAELTSIEDRLKELEKLERQKQDTLNTRNAKNSKLLSALLRIGRNPPPVMITRREDALKMVRSAKLLGFASDEMTAQALVLVKELNELIAVKDKVSAERNNLQAEKKRHSDNEIVLAGLIDERKRSLSERRAELDKVRIAQVEISKSVDDLKDLIKKMDQASRNAEREAYEQEAKRQAAAESAAHAAAAGDGSSDGLKPGGLKPSVGDGAVAGSGASSPGPADGEQKVAAIVTLPPKTSTGMVELAPHGSSLVPGSPGRIKPAIPFQLAKAKLPLPAQGRRVLSFGEKTQFGGHSKGIVIETRFSAQITSPCDGWIVYAGEFRSYGQLLIINAGGGYHVLMAGLSQIDVQPGQFVLAAEPVGVMSGASKSASAGTQSNAPVLYVEFRKDGDPIDPQPWWVEGQQKAQNEQKVQG